MKTIKHFSFILLICIFLSINVLASSTHPLLVDNADLLTDEEYNTVLDALTDASDNEDFDFVIVTEKTLNGKDATEYADDFFDYNGYGRGDDRDGVLLLLAMDEGEWAASTSGIGVYELTAYEIDVIMEEIVPYLSSEDYESAFLDFADLAADALSNDTDDHYDVFPDDFFDDPSFEDDYDTMYPEENASISSLVVICLVIGIIGAAIITGVMKSQLKSVRYSANASIYTKNDSLNITRSSEHFLYRNVSRTPRQNNNSGSHTGGHGRSGGGSRGVHISSSGRSHGGSRGRF